MKQNHHFVIPQKQLTWLLGKDTVSVYGGGKDRATHYFCSFCGVCVFYIPRSNPDGYGITVYCVDGWDTFAFPKGIVWKNFDGVNWEESIKTSDIVEKSKI